MTGCGQCYTTSDIIIIITYIRGAMVDNTGWCLNVTGCGQHNTTSHIIIIITYIRGAMAEDAVVVVGVSM